VGWLPLFGIAALGVLVVAALAGVTLLVGRGVRALVRPVGTVAEERSEPRTDAEELVKRWVLNNAPDRKEVKFTRWGPHMTGREVAALVQEAGLDELARDPEARRHMLAQMGELDRVTFVRVCYRAPGMPRPFVLANLLDPKPESHRDDDAFDQVFLVKGKLVYPIHFENDAGDNWKNATRKELARFFPAIDVEQP
jgi:hypothetical protein